MKARLQEEGREARNLVAYSLPLQDATTNLPSGTESSKFDLILTVLFLVF